MIVVQAITWLAGIALGFCLGYYIAKTRERIRCVKILERTGIRERLRAEIDEAMKEAVL